LRVEALHDLHDYSGDDFKVVCPTQAPAESDLWQVAAEISRRLIHIFLRDSNGRRPVAGDTEFFQSDPHWRDLILFYEYFHGDNGAGIGASHQTGWTGLVAKLIEQSGEYAVAAPVRTRACITAIAVDCLSSRVPAW